MTATGTPPTDVREQPTKPEPTQVGAQRRNWILPVALLAAAALLAGFLWTNRTTTATEAPEAVVAPTFAEVVRADLTEQSSFGATLGRIDASSIGSQIAGTVTAAPSPGTVIGSGDPLFHINGEPIVLFEGASPAWRALSLDASAEAVTGNRSGTVTATIEPGATATQGEALYSVDNEPVVALYGATPAFRTMQSGDVGPDVLQLETALAAMGYDPDGLMTLDDEFTSYTSSLVALWETDLGLEADGVVSLGSVIFMPEDALVTSVPLTVGQSTNVGQPAVMLATGDPLAGDDVAQLEAALVAAGYDVGTVDDRFDAATRAAVLQWQDDIGAEADGIVDLGEVVFGNTPVRVADNLVAIGGSVNPGANVLAVTSETTVVSVDLPAEDQGVLTEGLSVDVELPDGQIVPASVTSVSTIATVAQGAETTFPVEILLDNPADAGNLEEAPVDVLVVTDSVEGAVAVPVTALLALSEGGYAVEVRTGTGTQLVGVEPGFFADGLVEVTDTSLQPGDEVVVP